MYVDRDADGHITSTYSRPQREGHEYAAGAVLAEIKTPEQIRDEDLQSIVLDLDGDGVRVIQCRPAKFAQDESNMRNAIEKMGRDGTADRLWFMADDSAHLVTVTDLEASIVSGQDQASDIWDQFFLAIQG